MPTPASVTEIGTVSGVSLNLINVVSETRKDRKKPH